MRHLRVCLWTAFAVLGALAFTGQALAVAQLGNTGLRDFDARSANVSPTVAQRSTANALHASAHWNRFGTPSSLTRLGGYLSTGVAGDTAVAAARNWLGAHSALFRLASADGLVLHEDSRLADSKAHAVTFRQTYGGLKAVAGEGLVTVAVVPGASGWKVTFVSSTLSPDTALDGAADLSSAQAWTTAAANVGVHRSILAVRDAADSAGWNNLRVDGLKDIQRVKLGGFPLRGRAVPAYETIVSGASAAEPYAYRVIVDARNGAILSRTNLVDNAAQADAVTTTPFSGEVPEGDGACDVKKGPFPVAPGTKFIHGGAASPNPNNDMVLNVYHGTELVLSQDTLTNPETFHYEPPGGVPAGDWFVEICDFPGDGDGWHDPRTYTGEFITDDSPAYLARWKAFKANPPVNLLDAFPWNNPSTDTRSLWCWLSSATGCDIVVKNSASRGPWDYDQKANAPTFTTRGNNNVAATSWTHPFAPSPPAYSPTSPTRDYSFPWTNVWFTSRCAPVPNAPGTDFPPLTSWDADAATVNLFVQHNRLHDWQYFLGFTENTWNSQADNFGNTGPLQENDPLIGDVQAGALIPGVRDNANMITMGDGTSSITNMYLWQAFAGSFYPPCADGDYDTGIIGHEFGHMVENRMIGKGTGRNGFHAGSMGEAFGDLNGMEYQNENGFVPTSDENPFAVGVYATGNKTHAIRDYGMNWPRTGGFPAPGVFPEVNPLNFSDVGFDTPGPEVHADGEIWVAVNFDVRQAFGAKYNASFPVNDKTLQSKCANGVLPPENCPGNRRWFQLVHDAMLLMSTSPTMLDARDAMLASDVTRFGGANQAEIWNAFARRGFGRFAALHSAPDAPAFNDTEPVADFSSDHANNATITFDLRAKEGGGAVVGNVYVGHYEARVSPIADTNPATSNSGIDVNRDATAQFVPGTYEFLAVAPGYGFARFTAVFAPGQTRTVTVQMPTNWASAAQGATATGDGTNPGAAIDETEATNWFADGRNPADNTLSLIAGKKITVDLAGTAPHPITHVQVSAMISPGNNRFTALRAFEIWACHASGAVTCASDGDFTKVYTSAANAFPGDQPRPVAPEMILRDFAIPTTPATHLQLRVLTSQCTGNPAYQGDQDNDPLVNADCDSNVTAAASRRFVRAAELQAFTTDANVPGPPVVTPPPPSPQPPPKTKPKRHCVVPRTKGMLERRARGKIKRAGCRVGKVKRVASRKMRAGRVLAQSPRAGARRALGARVNLVVSKGRAARSTR